ncbi:endonuclease/exonuclease/phosphatase family protein [Oleisolibacter albus]|uniref:endonuclease/exonuclease/phosphatase family protein n=1 Tax=Oleisolibacter albus TaxID=2171757 RepID=UPI000DF1C3B7|nr:endonuclease/exonuclease/phosphatase family protein [Oleisolibacter albus]
MKTVSFNIRAGGGQRIGAIRDFIEGHDPDVIILTEWRNTDGGRSLQARATSHGMHCATLNDGSTANGIFVAAREPFAAESRTPPGKTCAGALLQIRFTGRTMLACYFPQRDAKVPFFDAVLRVASENRSIPFLLVGDLNTGNQIADRSPAGGQYSCAPMFDALSTPGGLIDVWRQTQGADAREWTWLSRTGNGIRIDHAFANTAYLHGRTLSCTYDHTPRSLGFSDHSALVLVEE